MLRKDSGAEDEISSIPITTFVIVDIKTIQRALDMRFNNVVLKDTYTFDILTSSTSSSTTLVNSTSDIGYWIQQRRQSLTRTSALVSEL